MPDSTDLIPPCEPRPAEDPDRWYSTNLVGLSTHLLGSTAFNRQPAAISIHGTRETHRGLFQMLERCADQRAAAAAFEHYMALEFDLPPPLAEGEVAPEPRRYGTSYIELLRGWGFDSNSPQGAVLKGWVESRFGLVPVFHQAPLGHFPSPAWITYLEQKMGSRYHNNCINFQLDLLYEYCQWSLRRFRAIGPRFVRLWRGTNHFEEQQVSGSLRQPHCVLRLNNLVSFSLSQERAEEFGDWILETEVPTAKMLFFPGLLGDPVLMSEGECLVIGGKFQVRAYHGYISRQYPRGLAWISR